MSQPNTRILPVNKSSDTNGNEETLRHRAILSAVEYYRTAHMKKKPFSPPDRIPCAGRVFDEREIENLVDCSLEFWLTAGRYTKEFEAGLARFLGVQYCSLVNSGSSANFLAFMALTSPKLGDRRIRKGDEVITTAVCFPTTVSPVIFCGAVPVFVDVELPSYNIDCSQLEGALSEKTKAVILAHTMGNPFNAEKVKDFCDRHKLWLIEDNCDALGSRYLYKGEWRYTGAIGDIGTSSFYPAHHITTGEGGAVYTNDMKLKRIMDSLRDWGRDCWCQTGHDNTCTKRFSQKFGQLPRGYDHKYVYSHFGYNCKATDMQAAIGCAQLEKLPSFTEARKRHWTMLKEGLAGLADKFILSEPEKNSDPSWFGFAITVRKNAGFTREDIVRHLEDNGIQTRMLFAGNIIRQPCFDDMRKAVSGYRIAGDLKNTDIVTSDTFWVGVYPGLVPDMISHMIRKIKEVAER